MIAKDTQFASTVNGVAYVFATTTSTTINVNANGIYTSANVELSQGLPLTHRYTANTNDPDQKFILPNANTDTSTLVVKIQTSHQIVIPSFILLQTIPPQSIQLQMCIS